MSNVDGHTRREFVKCLVAAASIPHWAHLAIGSQSDIIIPDYKSTIRLSSGFGAELVSISVERDAEDAFTFFDPATMLVSVKLDRDMALPEPGIRESIFFCFPGGGTFNVDGYVTEFGVTGDCEGGFTGEITLRLVSDIRIGTSDDSNTAKAG